MNGTQLHANMADGTIGLGRAMGSVRNRSYDDLTYALLPRHLELVKDDMEEFIFYHGDCSDVDCYKHHKVDENDIATLLGGGRILHRTAHRSLDVNDFQAWRRRVRGIESEKITGTTERVVALSKLSDELSPPDINLVKSQLSHDRSQGLFRRLRSKISSLWQKNHDPPQSSLAISNPQIQADPIPWQQVAPYAVYPVTESPTSVADEDPTRPSFTALTTQDCEETQSADAHVPQALISAEPDTMEVMESKQPQPPSYRENLGEGVLSAGLPTTHIDLLQPNMDTAKKLALEKYVDKPLSPSDDIDWETDELHRGGDEASAFAQEQTHNENTRPAPLPERLPESPVQDYGTHNRDYRILKKVAKKTKQSSVREWLLAQNNENSTSE